MKFCNIYISSTIDIYIYIYERKINRTYHRPTQIENIDSQAYDLSRDNKAETTSLDQTMRAITKTHGTW
jgi:hypothetical protein